MKGELKAGGLALVVGDNPHTGKCVTLVQLVGPGQMFKIPGTNIESFVKLTAPVGWLVTGNVHPANEPDVAGWALFTAKYLLPIDGDDHQERDQLAKDKPREVVA